MPSLRYLLLSAAFLVIAQTARAQTVLQDFETGLKYELCYVGENVDLSESDVPLQGQWRLQTGPLNANKSALYQTPYLSLSANAAVRFIHRNESTGQDTHPTLLVDLLNADGSLFRTVYQRTHSHSQIAITAEAVVPQGGVYRVQFRFVSDGGNERIGLDDVRIDGAIASTAPPACGPVVPGVVAPTAVPDAGTSQAGAAAIVQATANDIPGTNPIDPATVDLQPETPGISATRDIRAADGTLIGRADVDTAGNVAVVPVPGFSGSLTVPYSVSDTTGVVSNTTLIIVSVIGVTLDLRVEAVGPPSAAVGEAVRYLTRVVNAGPGEAAQASFTFTASAALGSLSASCGATRLLSCSPPIVSGNTITIVLTALPAGTSTVVQLDGVILGGQGATATVTSTVTAVNPDVDVAPSNNSMTVTTALVVPPPGADVAVTITGAESVIPGQTATYSTTVTNGGPGPADGVQLILTAPAGFIFDGNSGDCVTAFPCALGTLPAGATRTITTRYRTPIPAGVLTTLPPVSVQAQATAATADPHPSNNTASAQTLINTSLDVAVAITPSISSAAIGQSAEVFVLAENAGPNPARSFTVQIVLPAGLTVTSATPSAGSISASGVWSIPDLGPGLHEELRLMLSPGATGVYYISAALTPPPTDVNADDDYAEGLVTGLPSADLATLLTTSTPNPPAGTTASVTVNAGNNGPAGSTNARVLLTLPAGLRLVSAAPPVGSFDAATLTWSLGSIAPGAIFAMPVVLAVDVPGQLAMSANIFDHDLVFDPVPVNNRHTIGFNAPSSADLVMAIVADIPSPVVGQLVAIRAVILNRGPSAAPASVVLFDAPAGALTVVSVSVSPGTTVSGGQWTLGTLAAGAQATLDAVIRIETPTAIPITATASTAAVDPDPSNNTASVTLNGAPDFGQVKNDFEDLTHSESCWIRDGMAPGGLTPAGEPFGRFQANPPLQLQVQMVSSQLASGADTLLSPWIQFYGAGAIRFATKVTDVTSSPRLRVVLEDVATRTPILLLDYVYQPPRLHTTASLTIPITATGIYRVSWQFTGEAGGSRAAIDDIVIDGTQVSAIGVPELLVRPYDCRPIIPGNEPPVATPDFATTPAGVPVSVPILDNDQDPDGELNPLFVDLDPTGTTGDTIARNIFREDGVLIGRAVYLPSGPALQFTPEPGITGTAEIPYTVQDNVGGVSNIAFVTILVGSVTADLAVSIAAPSSATVSQAVLYTVRVANLGPDGAVDVPMEFAFTGMTVQAVTCAVAGGAAACGSATVVGATVNTVVPGLASGSAIEYVIAATTPPSPTTVSGAATIAASAPVTDPVPANNSATASTQVDGLPPQVRADLVVETLGPAEVVVGERVQLIVDVRNRGPSAAAAVTMSNAPPPGFVPVGVTGACTAVPCTLGTMAVGESRRIVLGFVVGATTTVRAGVPAANVASASSPTPDPLPENNVSRFVTQVFYATDLAMAATARDAVVAVGRPARLTFTVSNAGPSPANAVAARIVFPPGLTFSSAIPAQAFDPATGVWSIGALGAGDVAELLIVVDATVPGTHATIGRLTAGTVADTDAENDEATVSVTAVAVADVGLSSAADNASPRVGDVVTLTLQAANAGPSPATSLTITGVLPAGLTYQSHTASQGSLDLVSGQWQVGTLAAGATATLTVAVRVDHDGVLNSSATVTAVNELDPDQADNSTGVLLNAGPVADVGIEISTSATDVAVGGTVAARVTVTNGGPSGATDVAALFALPAGLRVTQVTVSTGSISGTQWAIGALAAGGSATLDATAEVLDAGPHIVRGAVTHAEPDPNPVNDFAFVSINGAGSADLRLSLVSGTPNPLISGNATVYVVLTNEGHAESQPVDVALALAPGLAPLLGLASQGSFDPASRRWAAGPLPPGGSETLAVELRVSQGGLLPVTAGIVSPAVMAPIARLAEASITLEVYDPLRTVADLQLTMSATPRASPGGSLTIEAVALNAGSTYALDMTMTVALQAGATFVSATPSFRGVCTVPAVGAAGTVSCTWPGESVVGRGRQRLITVVAQAASGLPDGAILMFAGQVTSATFDPYPLNNAAQAFSVVTSASTVADVALAKTFADGLATQSVPMGGTVSYRVMAANGGPAAAANVTVQEAIPAGFVVTSAVASQGVVDATGVWSVGGLGAGSAATLDVVVVAGAAGRFELRSVRTGSTPVDANPSNDLAAIIVDVVAPGGGGRFVAAGNVDGIGAAEIITGAGRLEPPQLRVFAGDGRESFRFYAFDPRFQGGVRVAACDIDADGRDEIVAGAGPGGGPHIRIFKTFAPDRIVEVNSWYAFAETYNGGVWVACGDVTGDGAPEVIAGSGTAGPATVRVWETGLSFIRELFWLPVFSTPRPEARVAVCDVNGDGRHEILAASGPGGPVELTVVDPVAGVVRGVVRPLAGLSSGALVACGDVTPLVPGPEIIVAADSGSPPVVEFYSAAGARLAGVLAGSPAFTGGTRVAVGDVDAAVPGVEIIAGAGVGAVPSIHVASAFAGQLVELRRFVAPNVP